MSPVLVIAKSRCSCGGIRWQEANGLGRRPGSRVSSRIVIKPSSNAFAWQSIESAAFRQSPSLSPQPSAQHQRLLRLMHANLIQMLILKCSRFCQLGVLIRSRQVGTTVEVASQSEGKRFETQNSATFCRWYALFASF